MAEQKSFFTKTILTSDAEGIPTVVMEDVEVTVYNAAGTKEGVLIFDPDTPALTIDNPIIVTGGVVRFWAYPAYYRVHFHDAQLTRFADFDVHWDATSARDGGTNAIFIEDNSIAGAKLTDLGVTGSKLAPNAVTGAKIADGSVDAGHLAPATLVRGSVNPDGTVSRGTGFTSSKEETGGYLITFTTPFADVPIVTVTPLFTQVSSIDIAAMVVVSPGVSPTAGSIYVATISTGVSTDLPFYFIAVAQ